MYLHTPTVVTAYSHTIICYQWKTKICLQLLDESLPSKIFISKKKNVKSVGTKNLYFHLK